MLNQTERVGWIVYRLVMRVKCFSRVLSLYTQTVLDLSEKGQVWFSNLFLFDNIGLGEQVQGRKCRLQRRFIIVTTDWG